MKPIDPDTWTRIEAILEEALELEGAELAQYLDRACGTDADLRRHIEELLEADSKSGDFLDQPAGAYAAPLLGMDSDDEPRIDPESVPPYRLLEEVGRGGMGTVYRAERADGQFEQQVAIKLVHAGTEGSREIQTRFLRERQILAGLEHPHVARLLDGGVSKHGQPYFAMEYVQGESILAYADRERLSVKQRLLLFEQVCEAVAYAQSRLVVHRDLKPSNIQVNVSGKVKLLDFGIARILDPTGDPGVTMEAGRLLTPGYAAPEQVRGEPVTTATDVYALGVVLYELLTGHRPYREQTESAIDRLRQAAEEETELASKKVTRPVEATGADGKTVQVSAETVAGRRRTTPESLRRRLAGDLDTILAHALAKEPGRRYQTAAALLEDLERHRRNLPIAARKPTLGYQAAKYIRRHRIGVAAAAAVMVALVVGGGIAAWQAKVASREADRATRIKEFLVSVFEEADPYRGPTGDITAKDVLDRGALRLDEELREEPEIQSELQGILAGLYDGLGEYDASLALAEKSLRTRRLVLGPDRSETAESMDLLAGAHRRLSHYEEADSLYRAALAVARGARDDELVARILTNLAGSRRVQGEYAEAESLSILGLELDRRRLGENHPEVTTDLGNLALIVSKQGHFEEAEAMQRDVLTRRRAETDGPSLKVAEALHNLAYTLLDERKFEESHSAFEQAVNIKREVYGGAHPSVALSLRYSASALTGLDELEQAHDKLEEALEMTRTLLGERHEDVAVCLNELAINYYYQGQASEAARRFRLSLEIFEEHLSPDHPTVITLRNNVATMEMEAGNLDAAETVYHEVLERRRESLGPRHPHVAFTLVALGNVNRRRGDSRVAADYYGSAVEIYTDAHGEDNVPLASAQAALGRTYVDLKRFSEAETLFKEARAANEEHLAEDHRQRVDADVGWGRFLIRTGRPEEALPILQNAESLWREKYGVDDSRTARARCLLGECLLMLGRGDEAVPLLRAAQPVLRQEFGENYPPTREATAALNLLP